eukprot:GHVU01231495.1.p1 GENE.GHVU01231495.1~~GHVU01231495.1.p1  ORF type:complete len:157 (+),score=14.74 GHVU01231495.1:58-471(+)
MGAQMVLLADYLCRKSFSDEGWTSGPVVERFKIANVDVIARSKYRYDAPNGKEDVAAQISFSSYITSRKSDEAKVKSIDYTPLGLGQPISAVERSGPEPPRTEEEWYTDLKEKSAEWNRRQSMYNFDELWNIDAKFR